METGYDPAVWDQMARQLRLPGLALPGDYGGDGFGLTELGVVLEEMGARCCARRSSPRSCSPPRRCSPRATRRPARGTCPASPPGRPSPRWPPRKAARPGTRPWSSARAERTADGWALTGKKSFVIDGATADLVLVVARSTAGPALFAVDRGAPGLRAEPMTTLDPTRPMAALTFDRVPAVLVGAEGQGGRLMSRVLDLACVALAAEQAGGARRCLEMSAGVRQDPVPVRPADRLLPGRQAQVRGHAGPGRTRRGDGPGGGPAGRRGRRRSSPVAAATAHVCCSQAYMFAAAENIQVHGGIGFTWEHPAHLYFRRAKSSELLFGGPAVYHERLLDRLGI